MIISVIFTMALWALIFSSLLCLSLDIIYTLIDLYNIYDVIYFTTALLLFWEFLKLTLKWVFNKLMSEFDDD